MLSSWFGLEPIPICSIDRAPFSGPESRSGASLTDWTTGKIGIDPALGAHLRGLLAVLRRRLDGCPGLCGLQRLLLPLGGLLELPLRLSVQDGAGLEEPLAPLLGVALGQGLAQVVRQLRFMRFAHSGPS